MNLVAGVAAVGALATLFSMLAWRRAHQNKGTAPAAHRVSVIFWATVSAYMLMFTVLRLAHVLGTGYEEQLFLLQTVAGACTIVSLAWIMIGIGFGHNHARLGAEIAGVAATVVLTLVFALGVNGPRIDNMSIEFIPTSTAARHLIATVYVAAPVAMSAMVAVIMRNAPDIALRRRSYLFCTSVVLMFVPNAGKYVTFIDGPLSVAMAVVMMCGTFIGWRAYKSPDNA